MTDPSAPAARRGLLLAVLSGCSFVQPMSMFILSPLLLTLATEFHVTVAQAGYLVAATSLPSAALALFVGPLSDFVGRRPLLLGGTALLAISSVTSAIAPTFELILASRVLAGFGLAAMGPSIFASVGDLFPYRERGRAYAWTVGANTMASIIGIPMATLLAAALDWRWSFMAVGILSAAAVIVLTFLFRPTTRAAIPGGLISSESKMAGMLRSYKFGYSAVFHTPTALAVFGSSFSMSVGLNAFETYIGALLLTRYQIGLGELAPVVGMAGLGTLVGSQIGGRLGDRWGHKRFMSISVLFAAVFVLILGYADVNIWVAGLLNFLRSVPMGMRFTAASAIISEAVPEARATMQAVNQSSFNLGVTLGSSLGGAVVVNYGYSHVSLMTAVGAVVSAILITVFVVENRGSGSEVPLVEAEAAMLASETEAV